MSTPFNMSITGMTGWGKTRYLLNFIEKKLHEPL